MFDCMCAQVVMVPVTKGSTNMPSGRGIATHGAPLGDGNIAGRVDDIEQAWRSVAPSGEVIQAFRW